MKQGSNQAIRFYVVETLKEMYRGDDQTKVVPKPLTGIFGATAGACSVFGNTPLDVIKTRMQVCETSVLSLECPRMEFCWHVVLAGLDIGLVGPVARGASRFENLLAPQKTYWPGGPVDLKTYWPPKKLTGPPKN